MRKTHLQISIIKEYGVQARDHHEFDTYIGII